MTLWHIQDIRGKMSRHHLFHRTEAYTHDEQEGAKSFATSKFTHSNLSKFGIEGQKQKKSSESQISSIWYKC